MKVVIPCVHVCFNVMDQNINKAKFAGNTLIVVFCNILTCMDNYIWQFFMLMEIEVTV